ncbi:MAG: Pr6Pr family membrane protein [Clostridia bacterium]|nr:Pr6Pr family membrane protein [Clostridia bacterium]
MLSLIGPCTRLGVLLSAMIVVFGVIGMTMHRDFYAGRARRDFFCFYTNVSNMAVVVYFALAAPRLYASEKLHPLIPHAEFAVMMCIMLTFCVFHLILFPPIRKAAQCMPRTREYFIVCTDNLIIHYLVPLTVFAYWLLCSPGKIMLRPADALYWTALPLIYIAYIFLRARKKAVIEETGSPYPYPFLDTGILGSVRVLSICAGLYALCVFSGLCIIALIRLLST